MRQKSDSLELNPFEVATMTETKSISGAQPSVFLNSRKASPVFRTVPFFAFLMLLGAACGNDPEKHTKLQNSTEKSRELDLQATAKPELRAAGEPNQLINESSPYLLQHAYDPVNWLPWGDQAFQEAKAQNKPIFLSIGYSTCHWCHVMEEESFMNDEIASFMNEHFISIKVDREERPDVDAVYMAVTKGITGRGGWPLNVWLTPDRLPITAGTYFPREDRRGQLGLMSLLRKVSQMWSKDSAAVLDKSEKINEWMQSQQEPPLPAELSKSCFEQSFNTLLKSFDAEFGGFGNAPKFLQPHGITALLRYHAQSKDPRALHVVQKTLDNMAAGGVHDQIGGGFHRYSVDRKWLLPHFEKMLYDQALLGEAYLEAWLVTGKKLYADVVRSTLDCVLRDFQDETGGFYSAIGADSGGGEGSFYTWTLKDLEQALGEDWEVAAEVWGCTTDGNFLDETTGKKTGANILHLPKDLATTAATLGIKERSLLSKLGGWKQRLLEVRLARPHPHVDDKILADWNGLMIGTLARAGAVLDEPKYVFAARDAADFISVKMLPEGRLQHRYRSGTVGIKAFAADYAYLANGLFDLYEAGFDARWLRASKKIANELARLFLDPEAGLLTVRGSDDVDPQVIPPQELIDGALPDANSSGAYAFVRLGWLLQEKALLATGRQIIDGMSGRIAENPAIVSYALRAVEWVLLPVQEVVIAGPRDSLSTQSLIRETKLRFLPRTLVVLHEVGEQGSEIRELVPFVEAQRPVDGKPAAYVCEDYTCELPVTNPEELAKLLLP